jgi:hypothetical protein
LTLFKNLTFLTKTICSPSTSYSLQGDVHKTKNAQIYIYAQHIKQRGQKLKKSAIIVFSHFWTQKCHFRRFEGSPRSLQPGWLLVWGVKKWPVLQAAFPFLFLTLFGHFLDTFWRLSKN